MCIINYFIINILVLHTHTCVLRYYKYTCVTYTYMYIILLQYNCITGIHIHVDYFIPNTLTEYICLIPLNI
jgi:hypothetical protein